MTRLLKIIPTALSVGFLCACIQPGARTQTPCAVEHVEEDWLAVFDEHFSGSYNLFGYDSIMFGPIGQRMIDGQSSQDMQLLEACLSRGGDPTSVVVKTHGPLPCRRCDYALLVAEAILMRREPKDPVRYSFGPYSCYEYRDNVRCDALGRLFGHNCHAAPVEYVYVDEEGNDISESQRLITIGIP